MFVLLKGATKEQAFKIGNEIAEAVTATNPKPIKLKFEKVVFSQHTRIQQTHTGCSHCNVCAFGFVSLPIVFFGGLSGVPALRVADKEALCGLHVREP